MDILVLGGSGFLSSQVCTTLRDLGHVVTVFTRGRRPLPDGVAAIHGDRKDAAGFPDHFLGRAFDAVVDCICYTPEEAQSALRAFAGRVGQYVMISTDFVYGRHRRLPMDEDTPTHALNDYGRGKAASEEILFGAWRDEGFPATVLRPPHIMGERGQLGTGSLQGRDPMLLDRLQQGAPVPLLDGGQLLIQPVVHRDIAAACGAVVGNEQTFGQAYNVSGPDRVTTRQYYDLVAATVGVEEPRYLSLPSTLFLEVYPDREPFALHRIYDVEKLARDTGYRPTTTLQHAVFEMVDWLQTNDAAKPYVETERDTALAALCGAFDEAARGLLRTG
jgi:nucleoside-diphosphate-sugar epimerase